MNKQRSLADLRIGEEAVITAYLDEDVPVKLYEMGLLPGASVQLRYRAPFNGPLCIAIGAGSHLLALRLKEARSICIANR